LTLDIIARPYQEGDESQIVPLLKLIFDKWPYYDVEANLVDYWRWRYLDNPFGSSVVTCVEFEGKIIGVNHGLPTRIKIGSNKYKCAYYTNFGVHPDFRRMGVSKKIGIIDAELYQKAEMNFLYLVTVNPIVIKSSHETQALFPYQIKNLVWIKDLKSHINETNVENPLGMRASFQAKKTLNVFKTLLSGYEVLNTEIKIVETQNFSPKADVFWEEVRDHYDFIIERDRAYLNWRYCDKRGGNYKVLISEEDGRMLGYVVLSINKQDEYHKGYFVDILTLPDRLDVAGALINKAINYYEENLVNFVQLQLVHGDPVEKIFKAHGFQEVEHGRHFFISPEMNDILLKNRNNLIHFSFGDLSGI